MTPSLQFSTLRRVSEHFGIGTVVAHHPLSGGHMAQVIRLETAHGRFVLRKLIDQKPAIIQARHQVLSRLSGELPEVVPVLAGADQTTVVSTEDGVYELSPYVEGRTWDHTNYPFDDERLLEEAAGLLARLHIATRDWVNPFEGIVPQACTNGFEMEEVRSALMELKEHETAQKLLEWLERLRKLANQYGDPGNLDVQQALLHGDYGYYNMIFNKEGTGIRSLIDFDQSRFGAYTYDLAYALFIFAPLVPYAAGQTHPLEKATARARRFVATYEGVAGKMGRQRMSLYHMVVWSQLSWVVASLNGLVRGDVLAKKNLWLLQWQPEIVDWLVANEAPLRAAMEA